MSMKYLNIKKIIKNVFVMFLMSANVYAAIVSDNDGSAFITKAEFDSLRNDFQTQLNTYNVSIDSKIDSAIASYLAGIKVDTQVELPSILNNINQAFVDSNTMDWPKSQLDGYYRYFINLGCMTGDFRRKDTFSQIQYLTGRIDVPAWKTIGTTDDCGVYYYGTKTDDGNYVMTKYTHSQPYSSIMGVYTTAGAVVESSADTLLVQAKTYVNDNAQAFETAADTWQYTCGGLSHTNNVTKAFGINDSFYDVNLEYVTGNKLIRDDNGDGIDDNIYFLESKDLNVPGPTLADALTDALGYEIRYQSGGTGHTVKGWTTTTSANTKLRIYNHKHTVINRERILNNTATSRFGDNVFYYNGLPIFKNIDKSGKIKMKLKFENAGGLDTVYRIQAGDFDNTALSTSGYSTEYKEGDLMIAPSGSTITLEIKNVNANEVWWIKARPLGMNNMNFPTMITTEQITLTYENK